MRGMHFLFTSRAFVKLTQDFKVDSETMSLDNVSNFVQSA